MTIWNMPTPGSLLAALIYVAAAALAWRAARRLRRDRPAAWRAIAVALVVLAFLRLFDVEQRLSRTLGHEAWQAGWYRDRASVQRIAVGVALAIGLVGAATAVGATRRLGRALGAALIASALLALLAALRIISLHATDHLLRAGWGPITLSRAIEGGALAIVLIAAGLAGRGRRRR